MPSAALPAARATASDSLPCASRSWRIEVLVCWRAWRWRPPRCRIPPTSSVDVRPPRSRAHVRRPRGIPRAPPRRSTDRCRPRSTPRVRPNPARDRRGRQSLQVTPNFPGLTASTTARQVTGRDVARGMGSHAQPRFNAHQSTGRPASSSRNLLAPLLLGPVHGPHRRRGTYLAPLLLGPLHGPHRRRRGQRRK